MSKTIADRLAVCSWSLQPSSPAALIEALDKIGIKRVQLALDPIREGGAWADGKAELADAGVEVVSGMFGTVGEDYTTMETIKATGGVVPDATWPQTWDNIQRMAPIAVDLGIKLVTFHAGFLPHEQSDPAYAKLTERIATIADLFAQHGLDLGFETGQEDADTLLAFLEYLGCSNVGVNFDPANMILYDKGDPVTSLSKLIGHVKQCHIKDATKTATPGVWGAEVTVGTGEVDWPEFFGVLDQAGFAGDLAIEREAGDDRIGDIRKAKEHVVAVTVGS
ncbi:MAG: TIM barrel protein [Phycisphaera sp.]|nr:TIM barrel protein [Phycisphaera sp.]